MVIGLNVILVGISPLMFTFQYAFLNESEEKGL